MLLCLQVGEGGEVEQLDGIQVEAGLFHSNGNRDDAISFTLG